MKSERMYFATAYDSVNLLIYVFGGCTTGRGDLYLNLSEQYSILKDEWTDISPMTKTKNGK